MSVADRPVGNLNLNLRVVQGLAAVSLIYDLAVGVVFIASGDGVSAAPYVFRAVIAVGVIVEMERIHHAYNQAILAQKTR